MPRSEAPLPIEKKKKYTAGFLREWSEDIELRKRAKHMADFFTEQFAESKLEVPEGEVALIHFTDNEGLKSIEQGKRIKNSSNFFDCDQAWLKGHGCDVETIKTKFGDAKSVVAIPLNSFDKWANTLSWIKGVQHEAFQNAVIFTIPRDDLILRNHEFTENSFAEDLKSNNQGSEAMSENIVQAYDSTQRYDENVLKQKDFMPEIWIPQEVKLGKYKIIKYPNNIK